MWLPVMMYVSVHVVVVVTSLAGLKPANFFVLSTIAEKVGGIEDFLIGGGHSFKFVVQDVWSGCGTD